MKRWVLVVVASGCSGEKSASPPLPPPASPPLAAVAPPIDASDSEELWVTQAISSDGTRAVQSLAGLTRNGVRVIAIDTNAVETAIRLPILGAAGAEGIKPDNAAAVKKLLDNPELATELTRAAEILRAWPLGQSYEIAASPDGHHVAFQIGDHLYTAVDGKALTVLRRNGYQPAFTPDGKSLLFIGSDGDDLAALYAQPIDGRRAERVPGVFGMTGELVVVGRDQARAIISPKPFMKPVEDNCVIELSLVRPIRAKRLACLRDHDDLLAGELSPDGTWAAFETVVRDVSRLRTVEVATGRVVFDRTLPPGQTFVYMSIDNHGLLAYGAKLGSLSFAPPAGAERTLEVDPTFHHARFRSTGQLVGDVGDGRVLVVAPAK